MSLRNVSAGQNIPDDFNVIIEISSQSDPVKYEIDKETGAIFVDRFMGTSMHYPCNYGYINKTLAGDGDPVDVLVLCPFSLPPGVVVRCRPLGMLEMEDESGPDAKILAVPVDKLSRLYRHYVDYESAARIWRDRVVHFFEHYKDLEPNKWVKVHGWQGIDEARQEIIDGVERYQNTQEAQK